MLMFYEVTLAKAKIFFFSFFWFLRGVVWTMTFANVANAG